MKAPKPMGLGAAIVALLTVTAAGADAQQRAGGERPLIMYPPPTFHPRFTDGALRSAPPRHGGHVGGGHRRGGKFRGGHFGGFILVERERIVEIEVEREAPPAAPPVAPPPPPPPRKPYVIGNSYASLPGGCMKLIEDAASYYFCGGEEWYRQVGKQYRAVARKL